MARTSSTMLSPDLSFQFFAIEYDISLGFVIYGFTMLKHVPVYMSMPIFALQQS